MCWNLTASLGGGAGAHCPLPCFCRYGCHAFFQDRTFPVEDFDVAIVDEATQILNHNCWGYSVPRNPAGADAIGKFILIGDHKQLPAVVLQSSEQSEVCDEALQAIGLYNLKDSFSNAFIGISPRKVPIARHQPLILHLYPSSLLRHALPSGSYEYRGSFVSQPGFLRWSVGTGWSAAPAGELILALSCVI